MRLLVFGAQGQLGCELASLCAEIGCPAAFKTRSECDIVAPELVTQVVREVAPTVIVNAAAYTKVDQAEVDVGPAFQSNRDGPATLAAAAAMQGIPLVHISTDYVFDGQKKTPYQEMDDVGPLNVYGESKLAGEEAIRARLSDHIIIRTAWVYGRHGRNFLKTMLSLCSTRDELRVVADQVGNPTATQDLAQAVVDASLLASAGKGAWGTFHFAGAGKASWFEFAQEIVDSQVSVTHRKPMVRAIGTAEFPTRARRPCNSQLDSSLFAATFGTQPRPWQMRTRETVEALLAARS